MPFDLHLERQKQRQIVRNKYTSREFHIEWDSIIKEYLDELDELSRPGASLEYDIHLEKLNTFDTYYFLRCRCNEKHTTKKSSVKRGKPIIFPRISDNIGYKTFIIKYEKQLSPPVIVLLNSFNHKYFYFAMDDVLNFLKLDPVEQNNILSVLYLPALLLHNNFSISFFHMWIKGIYINNLIKPNKFLLKDFKTINYITIKLMYKVAKPIKKRKTIW